jgi:hypothetical protein
MGYILGDLRGPSGDFVTYGANPTIMNYNASVVKIYNAANSICSVF